MSQSKPIKILFDANPIVNGNKSGVGYYTYNLVESLAKKYPKNIVLVGHYFDFLGSKGEIDLPKNANISYVRSRLIPGKILSITRKFGFQPPMELFFKQKGDIALFTNFVCLPSILKIPTFTAVHDLCFEDVPEYVSEKNRKFLHSFVPKSIKQSTAVITISDSTKQAIKKYYAVADEKFLLTPIPAKPPIFQDKSSLKKLGIEKKYILFVSNIEPRKNFIGLVKAYEKCSEKIQKKYSLVLVGGVGWKVEDQIEYIEKLQSKGLDIILTGYVNDKQKASLYTNAGLFVMPSHYEGFGMPILEAMSYGLPVATSDIEVFREVAGDSVKYFNKDKPEDIAKKIEEILSSELVSKDLVARGNKLVKKYSWDEVAKTVYERVEKTVNS